MASAFQDPAGLRPLRDWRREILSQVPDLDTSRSHPVQLFWFPLTVAVIVALSMLIVSQRGAWGLTVPAALLLGFVYSSFAFYAHEILHGSILSPKGWFRKLLVRLIGWCGFWVAFISPEVWLTWHNRLHHFHANDPTFDFDTWGLWEDLRLHPRSYQILRRNPGSGHWLSWSIQLVALSRQALLVTWYLLFQSNNQPPYTLGKRLAVLELLIGMALWLTLGTLLPASSFFLICVVPCLITNLVFMSYVQIQHNLCPLTHVNDPLENTLGVESPRWIELLHYSISHHVEHHLFPDLNYTTLAKIRAYLRKEYPDRYRCLPHLEALRLVFKTPRVHRDAVTLIDPYRSRTFDVSGVGRREATVANPGVAA